MASSFIEKSKREKMKEGSIEYMSMGLLASEDIQSQNDTTDMTVRVSSVARQDKRPDYMYPYKPMKLHSHSYRGYPVDGASAFSKTKQWKIQIVAPSVGAPREPLPQFPQQEILMKKKDAYVGDARMELSAAQVENNSGEAYLDPDGPTPCSSYFYTAGYTTESAVKLQKPFPGSIYRHFVTGRAVPVKLMKSE